MWRPQLSADLLSSALSPLSLRLQAESSSDAAPPVASSRSLLEIPMQRDSFRHSSEEEPRKNQWMPHFEDFIKHKLSFWRTQRFLFFHIMLYSFCFRFFQINVKIYIFWFDEFVEKMNLRFSDFSLLHSIRISSNFRFSLLLKVIFIFYFITKQLNKRVPLQSYEPMVIKVVEQVLPNSNTSQITLFLKSNPSYYIIAVLN